MLDFEETIMEFEELTDEELLEAYKQYKNVYVEDYEDEEGYEDANTKRSAILHVMEERDLEFE